MENYKSRLESQREALQEDIDKMIDEIKDKEILLEAHKRAKSLAFRELRSIEKKLEKMAKK